MALLASALMSRTTHPGLRSHIGPNGDNLSWRLPSSKKSQRRSCSSARAARPQARAWPWESPRRDWFGHRFVFGAATSAYQIEGAWNDSGKGPSTWDHFCHNHPEGTLEGGINYKGIKYYKNLINMLKENGIEPYATIFHWDTPQALEDKYGGFLNRRIVKEYTDFAKVCFEHFGNKVKHWFTFNEPHIFCSFAYGTGEHAPGRCSPEHNGATPCGDSLSEPYRVGHNILLAHTEVADLYKKFYKTGIDWIRSYSKGLKDLLMIIKERYGNPPIYITENGANIVEIKNMLTQFSRWAKENC
ncbi:hypothetical protein C2845_PM18G01630 [Panicum miliaceum]|uniref:4-hydroxy-7-methoxy-3-oxo-3,4-dihydro-2H-1,4-benzoxazin-2-yl glucosidebeta-D-glucosidase n=1 Tax=Panicum miliaceum TaxID=4540 RepID=A0A3L6PGW9_PANMI|nr:hypothetical protein C2845_PM18G01630 [Panicum miliaceum]